MHSLNKIVETLKGSHTGKGLFFAWSSDGLRIGILTNYFINYIIILNIIMYLNYFLFMLLNSSHKCQLF